MTDTPKPLVFLDTETDGIHPKRQAWEIAMIRREVSDDGRTRTEFSCRMFVDIDLDRADPFALRVGGFYDRHPMGKWLASQPAHSRDTWPPKSIHDEYEPPVVAARTVARMTHGAQVVGVVPNFDTELLERLLRHQGLAPAWDYHLIDVRAMALGWLQARGEAGAIPDPRVMLSPSMGSDHLAERCGVSPASEQDRHTALGDARWAMRWYDAMTGGGDRG